MDAISYVVTQLAVWVVVCARARATRARERKRERLSTKTSTTLGKKKCLCSQAHLLQSRLKTITLIDHDLCTRGFASEMMLILTPPNPQPLKWKQEVLYVVTPKLSAVSPPCDKQAGRKHISSSLLYHRGHGCQLHAEVAICAAAVSACLRNVPSGDDRRSAAGGSCECVVFVTMATRWWARLRWRPETHATHVMARGYRSQTFITACTQWHRLFLCTGCFVLLYLPQENITRWIR